LGAAWLADASWVA
jgi:putative transposase